MVRRLNVDGDGQGDLGGHGGEQRAVLVYQRQSYEHWRRLPRPRRPRVRPVRRELHRRRAARRRGAHRRPVPDRRRRVRGHPAAGHVLPRRDAPGRAADAVAAGRPPPARLLPAGASPKGAVRAGDEIVTHAGPAAHELSVADIDALLYLPGARPRRAPQGRRHPRAEPRLAGVVPRPRSRSGAGCRHRQATGWRGFRQLRVARRRAREHDGRVDPPGRLPTASRCPRPEPGQFLTLRVPGAGDPAPVRSYSLSAAPSDREYRISVKRERRGQQLPPRASCAPGDDGGRRGAARRLRPGRRRPRRWCCCRRASASRRCWRCCTRSRPAGARGRSGGCTPPARPAEHAFAAEAHRLLASLPHGREHVFYTAEQRPLDAVRPAEAVHIGPCRPTVPPTSAARTRS